MYTNQNSNNTIQTSKQALNEDCSTVGNIIVEFSQEDFLRKVWNKIAEDNPPLDVFEMNFDEIGEIEHQIAIDYASFEVECSASVGYDREESYTDFETYYEEIPYTEVERYFDKSSGTYKTGPVTKHKKVERQRAVTKYRTVTDWRPHTFNGRTESLQCAENIEGIDFDDERFLEDYLKSETKEPKKEVSDVIAKAKSELRVKHREEIESFLRKSLPGDHAKDIKYTVEPINSSCYLYKAIEYKTGIEYKGKYYERRAFPFGGMKIIGEKIPNNESPEEIKKKMASENEVKNKKIKEKVPDKAFDSTKVLNIVTIIVLALSILTNLVFEKNLFTYIMFATSIIVYTLNYQVFKKYFLKYDEEANKLISENNDKTEKAIENYFVDFENKKQKKLKDKLDYIVNK